MAKLIRRDERNQPEDLVAWGSPRGGLSLLDPIRMVREMFQDPFMGASLFNETAFRPHLDVTEANDAFAINVDLPGVNEEDLEVSVTGNRLTVSGARQAEEIHEGDRYVAIERGYGTFSRSFVLPDSADLEHIEAQLKDGVLRIRVPKRGEMKGRKISIQGAAKSPEMKSPEMDIPVSSAPTEKSEMPEQSGAEAQDQTSRQAA